jgi:para-aminobenzoate synthetase component 1
MTFFYPLLPYQEPIHWFHRFPSAPGTLLLENASKHSPSSLGIGRYSYILWSPFLEFQAEGNQGKWISPEGEKSAKANALEAFFSKMAEFSLEIQENFPPFQGGAVGYFSYEMGACIEKLPQKNPKDSSFPETHFYFYAHGLSFDTVSQESWLFRQAFCPFSLEQLLQQLPSPAPLPTVFAIPDPVWIQSNFSKEAYLQALQKTQEYLQKGDIFQANISQKFQGALPLNVNARDLYLRLRHISPAPYAAYLDFGERQFLSSSPELFLRRQGSEIHTYPIKGTRKRGKTPEEDERLRQELWTSEKDNAELTMIVDLCRNDFGRVCAFKSISVVPPDSVSREREGIYLEEHPTVFHLLAHIQGTLRPEATNLDLFRASFPGGSITGAPKIRAMEIINELEPCQRGPYTGAFGWIGFHQDLELSIAIRILLIEKERFSFQVGGGIVIDSHPEEEYLETLVKAKGLLLALQGESCPLLL